MKRLAINGFGRIGRCVFRALQERSADFDLTLVAINELADIDTIAYLSRYDSTHGRFPGTVELLDNQLRVSGETITVSHHERIQDLPWQSQAIDLVLECTGVHGDRAAGQQHLQAGAGKVLFSQPASVDVDCTIVRGVNHQQIAADHRIVSNASCTTNCIVPVLKLLDDQFGIASGNITTLHSMMNDQPVLDAYHHTDLRKTRSASQSMIPVDTELVRGIGRLLPDLEHRLSAKAIRVPTVNVSAMDLVVCLQKDVSVEQVNTLFQQACETYLYGVLDCAEEPLASCDFNHDRHSGIVDIAHTSVCNGRLLNVLTWFDNEWGFANRMLEVADQMLSSNCG
ncbi:MAG: glyceraldehyde 3-phosphate dehydrogenase NAD-binding domain-containing protein [Pseudomonadota bacterium]